jgi:hypothetical protein
MLQAEVCGQLEAGLREVTLLPAELHPGGLLEEHRESRMLESLYQKTTGPDKSPSVPNNWGYPKEMSGYLCKSPHSKSHSLISTLKWLFTLVLQCSL